jgi:tRNA (guanine37-N1)-methyltransferase
MKKAQERGVIEIRQVNIRDFASGKHRKVDDRPSGGGPGMIMMPEPIDGALRHVKREMSRIIYLSPQGVPLKAQKCREFAREEHLIVLCGHYGGVDARVLELHKVEEVSIGDYVVLSGCSAAIVFVEAIVRFLPGVLGNSESADCDSFEQGMFDAPQFAGPEEFCGLRIPEVLKSGHHKVIKEWRQTQAREKTKKVRPELLA